MTSGRIIAYRADRLGARLVSLMNAMRIAEVAEADFACAWIETTGVGDVFNDPTELFDTNFVERHFIKPAGWRSIRAKADNLKAGACGTAQQVSSALRGGTDLIVGNAFGVIALKGEQIAGITGDFRRQLGRIGFSAPVGEAMRALDSGLAGHAAYHIRRGDLTGDLKAMNKAWPHKMVPDEFYETHMRDRLETSGGVVLFSDDAHTIQHYRSMFPALRIVSDVIDTAGLTEAQRDLVELYAMARCSPIIAPQRSAFSSTAADLFGSEKLPVTEALGKDQQARAHEALIDRIETRPDSFPGDGDIGQSLAHAGAWFERAGRWKDAARVFGGQIERGLNISFVYPRTLRYHLENADPDGAIRTAELMHQRNVVHMKDLVDAEILHGHARILTGDRARGLHHMANAFWHGSSSGLARSVIPLMVSQGWLNNSNFLPLTPLQSALDLRRGPAKTLAQDLPGIDGIVGLALPPAVGRLDAAVLEWGPLLRSVSPAAAVRTGAVDQFETQLARVEGDKDTMREVRGAQAMIAAWRGDTQGALDRLLPLAESAPLDWQVWYRLSQVYWIRRDMRDAAAMAGRAIEASPDAPMLRAWAGMVQLRARVRDEALANLEIADAGEVGFPVIPYHYAQALRFAGEQDRALEVVRKARDLARQEPDFALLEADLLEQSGHGVEAAAELMKLVEWQRATGRVFMRLVGLLRDGGNTDLAAEVARIAGERFPSHPRIAALSRDVAA
ncbi:MAG: hypothetical protein AAFN27_15465 [Pseudomonadota bacterium]